MIFCQFPGCYGLRKVLSVIKFQDKTVKISTCDKHESWAEEHANYIYKQVTKEEGDA
ncbi:hypothetical protein KAR91_45665 [Candidatus Pacearchaeota archaeon]|nr:hypothetical protein [Candidatus Pacearchaeota archaeon]